MKRLRICQVGCILLRIFCITTVAAIVLLIIGYCGVFPWWGNVVEDLKFWLITTGIVVLVEVLLFWVGIILVYLTSKQLGVRWRVLGIVCGWIPIANLVMLHIILKTASREVKVEKQKIRQNQLRLPSQICRTIYPILFVHGVFLRDFEHFNYWGRIPRELEKNGAILYYGNHNSAASVDDSAKELEARIYEIIRETGCEKLNIIAHSKGGLDVRTAIAKTSIAPYVASLTTMNTPHRGCAFADYLLEKVPASQQEKIAAAYNKAAAKLGDQEPDFMAAVSDLTSSHCQARNETVLDDPNIYYQSFGSVLKRPGSGRFPLNLSYLFVHYFDGKNDGLVGEKSFPWGSRFTMLESKEKRGISHGDIIDLNRENFKGFDVREFYVELVSDLREKGF